MPRFLLHCLLILALATAGTALPRHVHAQEHAPAAHAHHAMDASGHAGHAMGAMAADTAADSDCCADTGCDCGCAVAPAIPAPAGIEPRFAVTDAPAESLLPAAPTPRARPPLRPPAA